MSEQEAFSVLGIAPTDDLGLIRESYISSVKRWHPDRLQHDKKLVQIATQKTQELNIAFETLRKAEGLGKLSSFLQDADSSSNQTWMDHWGRHSNPPPQCEDFGIPLEDYLQYQSKYDLAFWRSTVVWIVVPMSLFWFNRMIGETGLIPFAMAVAFAIVIAMFVFGIMTLASSAVGRMHPLYHEIRLYKNALMKWSEERENEFGGSFRH